MMPMYESDVGSSSWQRQSVRVPYPFDAPLRLKATHWGALVQALASQLGLKYGGDHTVVTDQFLAALYEQLLDAWDKRIADREHADVIVQEALFPAEANEVYTIAGDVGLGNTEVVTTIAGDNYEHACKVALEGALKFIVANWLDTVKQSRLARDAA
jgi:hypothetical protein